MHSIGVGDNVGTAADVTVLSLDELERGTFDRLVARS